MAPKLTRRRFLQTASLAAASVPLSKVVGAAEPGLKPGAFAAPGSFKDTKTVTGGVCEMCFWRCQLVGKVRDGRLVKLEGNPKSIDNGKALCARGNAGIKLVYDPDRLKYPMKNVGKRGKPRWKKISWDEALNECATKLGAVTQKYGPQGLAVWYHGASAHYPTAFFEYLGVPNMCEPAFYQCRGQTAMAMLKTLGFVPNEDVDMANAKAMFLVGSHIGENIHLSHVRNFITGMERGAKIIVVDPRFSSAAAKADIWVKIKPATDTAFLLAIMNYLIDTGTYNKEFVENWCSGFEEFKKGIKGMTVARAAEICDVPAVTITQVAQILAENAPHVAVHPGRHATWYGNDFQRIRAQACLAALLGAYEVPGGIQKLQRLSTGHVHWPEREFEDEDYDPDDFALAEMEEKYPFKPPGTPTDMIRETMITGKPYPIKGMVVWGANPIKTFPVQQETMKALKNMDFVMVTDVSPTDITMWADILLPEACYLERYDHIEKGTQWNCSDTPQQFIAPRMPLIAPMFQRKDPVWIINGIAERMGFGKDIPVKTQEEYVDHCLEEAGLSLEKIRALDGIYIKEGFCSYCKAQKEHSFPTDSGKVELYIEELADEGFSPVPVYTKVPEPPKGYARMIYGRSPVHSFNRTQNNAWLAHEIPENPIWINDELAKKMGLKDGDRVGLENQDGKRSNTKSVVKVTPGIRKDVIYLAHGYGTYNPAMTVACGKGIDDQSLNTRTVIEPETGCCGMRINFVRIVKDGRPINIPS